MSVIVEIRAAEGGKHAKLLVIDQFVMYCKLAAKRGFSIELIDDRAGMITFKAKGDDALFYNEVGGHRIQMISPTDKNKRIHTSTITIATLPEITEQQLFIKENELEWKFIRGSGAGGQARNKTSNAVQLFHIPSKIMIRCESERSQHQNKESALELLRSRLWEQSKKELADKRINARKEMVGSGMRGDKRRTIRFQDEQVIDHITGHKWRLKDYIRGDWN